MDTYVRATRSIIGDHARTTSAKASASPARSRSTSAASALALGSIPAIVAEA